MALITWNDKLSVGVAQIDGQHKELVRLLNDLHDAAMAGQAAAALGRIFDALIAYTRTHFSDEERLMQRHAYPAFALHKAEHDKLTARALELQRELAAGRGTTVMIEAMKFLKEWLVHHIQDSDKKAGAFINQKAA